MPTIRSSQIMTEVTIEANWFLLIDFHEMILWLIHINYSPSLCIVSYEHDFKILKLIIEFHNIKRTNIIKVYNALLRDHYLNTFLWKKGNGTCINVFEQRFKSKRSNTKILSALFLISFFYKTTMKFTFHDKLLHHQLLWNWYFCHQC